MLNFIISILEKLLISLKNIQSNSTENMTVDVTKKTGSKKWKFGLLALFLIPTVFYIFVWSIAIFDINNIHFLIKSILILIILWISIWIFIAFLRNFTKKYLFLVHFPLLLSLIMLMVFMFGNWEESWTWNIFTILIGVYPLVYIFATLFKKMSKNEKINKVLQVLWNIGFNYNLGSFFLLSLNTTLLIFGFDILFFENISNIIAEVLDVSNIFNWRGSFISYILSGFFALSISFAFLMYPIYTLHNYFNKDDTKKSNVNKWVLILLLVAILIWIWNLRVEIYNDIINDAQKNFSEEGYNEKAYDDTNKFLLKHAFLYKIENNKSIDQDLFKKVFDTTPVWLYWEKISKYSSSRNSFATNISKVWDKADVVFELAEIENNFRKINNWDTQYLLETNYSFHFENQTNTNQEVIINFESPSQYSVVTDLLLGLNWELVGQISPRWAARKVYEDSLRRNTDPALIEKVWLNTYNLRIFPIPSKQVKQGKQKVVVKMVSPVLNEDIITIPKFSIINLKFNNESRLISKTYKDWNIITEDIIKSASKIKDFISKDQLTSIEKVWLWNNYTFEKMCIDPYLSRQSYYIKTDDKIKNSNKIHIFFDNSLSIQRNNADDLYKNIYSEIKNYKWKLQDVDVYSHNFRVNKVSDVSDIDFWWYSNIDGFINYLEENNINNQSIIYVTDDESFELNTDQNINYTYNKITDNQLSVIKIWKNIKSYKSDFNTLLAKSKGNIYEVNKVSDISHTIDKIFDNKSLDLLLYCEWETKTLSDKHLAIQAGIISSRILSSSEQSMNSIARQQTDIAEKYHIVNQYNSLIALETQAQQNDLNRYNNQSDKYSVEYDSWDNFKSNISSNRTTGLRFNSSDSLNEIQWWSSSSRGINFGNTKSVNSDLMWSSSRSYNRNIDINFIGFLLILIYLTQIVSFISFITHYIHRK